MDAIRKMQPTHVIPTFSSAESSESSSQTAAVPPVTEATLIDIAPPSVETTKQS